MTSHASWASKLLSFNWSFLIDFMQFGELWIASSSYVTCVAEKLFLCKLSSSNDSYRLMNWVRLSMLLVLFVHHVPLSPKFKYLMPVSDWLWAMASMSYSPSSALPSLDSHKLVKQPWFALSIYATRWTSASLTCSLVLFISRTVSN